MLSYARIKNDIIEFEFPLPIEEGIHNPKIYTVIDLKIVQQLKTKYSLALYEILKDYANSPTMPILDFDILRKALDIKEDTYVKINMFNNKVLKPAIEEINTYTDIKLDNEIVRRGKKPVGIKFYINKQLSDYSMPYKYDTLLKNLDNLYKDILIKIGNEQYVISYFEIRNDTDIFAYVYSIEEANKSMDIKFKVDLNQKISDIIDTINEKLEPLFSERVTQNNILEL
jgi:plasmid replication initiation protein